MNAEIDQYERIQEYLRGRMSDEDRAAFEKDLETDDSLREQCDDLSLLARSINKANQEADLRIALEETEKRFSSSPVAGHHEAILNAELNAVERELRKMGILAEDPRVNAFQVLKDRTKHVFKSIGQWLTMRGPWSVDATNRETPLVVFSRVGGVAARLAIVCGLALVCTVGALSYKAHSVGMGYQTTFGISRGADPITDKIQNGDYSEAQKELGNLIEDKKQQLQKLSPDSDQFQYISSEIDEMEFLDAVCDLCRGKYFSAKKRLKAIVEGESYYRSEAKGLLEQLF